MTLGEKLLQKAEKEKIPLKCLFELTNHCNLSCSHCYATKEMRQELSIDEIKDILDQLAKVGCLMIGFTGGDIFTRPDLLEIINYARERRFLVYLITNATLITEKIARDLKRLNIARVTISIYGPNPFIHEAITRVEGSFQRTIHGLNLLKAECIPIGVSCVLTNLNFKTYYQVGQMCHDMGVPCGFDTRICLRRDGSRGVEALRINAKQIREFYSSSIGISKRDLSDVHKVPLETRRSMFPCFAGHYALGITAYGDVLPCISFPITFRAGNLREKSFYEIWYNSLRLKWLRKIKFKDMPQCSKCNYILYCRKCQAETLLESGNVLAPSELDCKEAKVIASLYKGGKIKSKEILSSEDINS